MHRRFALRQTMGCTAALLANNTMGCFGTAQAGNSPINGASILQASSSPAVFQQARFLGHRALNSSLKEELQEELSRDDKSACPKVPDDWSVDHQPGSNSFTLKRTFHDEQLEVFCQLPTREPELADGEKTPEHYPFTLIVSKGGKAIDFSLSAIESELVVDGIAFHHDAKVPKDMSPEGLAKKDKTYGGPTVAELQGELVESFVNYLEERGVNDGFAEFIEEYAFWMEQQEYEAWLGDVADFVA